MAEKSKTITIKIYDAKIAARNTQVEPKFFMLNIELISF